MVSDINYFGGHEVITIRYLHYDFSDGIVIKERELNLPNRRTLESLLSNLEFTLRDLTEQDKEEAAGPL